LARALNYGLHSRFSHFEFLYQLVLIVFSFLIAYFEVREFVSLESGNPEKGESCAKFSILE
jgi:hypothetical protein